MSDKSEDTPEKPTGIYLGREEIRGVFVLGLLAVVTAVRIQYIAMNRDIAILIEGEPQNITIFFDAMIILWALYAFFMVLGISDDIIGERASRGFRTVSRYYLYVSFLILGLLAVVFYSAFYFLQAIGLSVFAGALFFYWFGKRVYLFTKRIREKGLSLNSISTRLTTWLKREWYGFLGSVTLVCFFLVLFGTHDEFIIPSAIIGSIFLILFLVMRERAIQNREKLDKEHLKKP
jgi:hypothetical protein